MYFSSIVSIVLALVGFSMLIKTSVDYYDSQIPYWGVNYLKAFLQDFLLLPLLGILFNVLIFKLIIPTKKVKRQIRWCLRWLADDSISMLLFALGWRKKMPSLEVMH